MTYLVDMLKAILFVSAMFIAVFASPNAAIAATPADTVIDGLDYGPLAQLVGTWKSDNAGGMDIAPGRAGSQVGKGGVAASPFYETITFSPAGSAVNASEQNLAAMYYRQQVFRKSDNKQFHDQVGYLIYDKKSQTVYDAFCIPRAVCVVADGKAGDAMTLTAEGQGIAQSPFMLKNDTTNKFTIALNISPTALQYREEENLQVYDKPFTHIDADRLSKVQD